MKSRREMTFWDVDRPPPKHSSLILFPDNLYTDENNVSLFCQYWIMEYFIHISQKWVKTFFVHQTPVQCSNKTWLKGINPKHKAVPLCIYIVFLFKFCCFPFFHISFFKVWYWNARPILSMVPASPNFMGYFLQNQRD